MTTLTPPDQGRVSTDHGLTPLDAPHSLDGLLSLDGIVSLGSTRLRVTQLPTLDTSDAVTAPSDETVPGVVPLMDVLPVVDADPAADPGAAPAVAAGPVEVAPASDVAQVQHVPEPTIPAEDRYVPHSLRMVKKTPRPDRHQSPEPTTEAVATGAVDPAQRDDIIMAPVMDEVAEAPTGTTPWRVALIVVGVLIALGLIALLLPW